jgi:hypothetical protein
MDDSAESQDRPIEYGGFSMLNTSSGGARRLARAALAHLSIAISLSGFLILFPGVVSVSEAKSPLADLLPASVDGWEVTEEDQTYNRDNLHDYIDGGAELYLSFGFAELANRRYARPGQPDIIVDVFDMGTSQNAFGVFSHSREVVDQSFGQGSQYTAGLMLFWKNNYYVSVLASPETPESKRAVGNLSRHIETAIAGEGPLPGILSLLPRASLVEESIRYFHHYIWLNSHYFVADENILHIDETCEAVLAKYGRADRRRILLLVKYPDEEKATLGYNDFVRHYLPELPEAPAVQIEDGTWAGCRRTGNLLVIVFNAHTKDEVLSSIESVRANDAPR